MRDAVGSPLEARGQLVLSWISLADPCVMQFADYSNGLLASADSKWQH